MEHRGKVRRISKIELDGPAQHEFNSLYFVSLDDKRRVVVPAAPSTRTDLQEIFADEVLVTEFHPVYSLLERRVLAVEGVARLANREGNCAVAGFEKTGELGVWTDIEIVRLHCALAAATAIPEGLRVGLKLTTAASSDPRIWRAFASATIPPDRFIVELTGRLDEVLCHVGEDGLGPLRALGLLLAVSPSDAAFASPYRIAELRPDIIKFNRQLVENIDSSKGQRIRARAILGLARQLGAEVIAEGIETTAELKAVTALGMTAAQRRLPGHRHHQAMASVAWRLHGLPRGRIVSGPSLGSTRPRT